jgi:hypothetical protein
MARDWSLSGACHGLNRVLRYITLDVL